MSLPDVFEPFGYDTTDVHGALAAAAGGVLSYRDAPLLGAAARAGHSFLISEDMQDSFRFADIVVVCPFVQGASNPRLETLLGTA